MKEPITLRILDLFQLYIEKKGIDFKKLRTILKYKFIMGKRAGSTLVKEQNSFNSANIFVIFMQLFMGLIPALFMLLDTTIFVKLSIGIGILLFVLLSTIISDFSWSILDIKDKNILLSKPIDDQLVSFAKTIFIIVFLLSRTFFIIVPMLIIGSIKYGVAFLFTMLLTYVFLLIFSFCFCHLMYALVLVYFDGEKLKDIINTFQVILMVVSTIAYQFVGEITKLINVNVKDNLPFWVYLMPSSWFSATFEVILANKSISYIALSLMALITTIFLFFIYITYSSKVLEKNLVKLNAGELEVKAQSYKVNFITNLFLNSGIQKASYTFSKAQLKRDRILKSKIYTTLASFIIVTIAPFVREIINKKIDYNNNAIMFLGMYTFIIGAISVLPYIERTSNKNAAWIYHVLPIKDTIEIKKGAFLAFFFNIVLPIFVMIIVLFSLIAKIKLTDIIIIFLVLIMFSLISFKWSIKDLPFSKDFLDISGKKNKASGVSFILLLVIAAGLGFLHYYFIKGNHIIYITIGVLLLLNAILYKILFKNK
ncbi:hypothetical protein ACAG39_10515 [Caldicellulosiruptoraceae bacterium PP1]